jgi:hypothetical protein
MLRKKANKEKVKKTKGKKKSRHTCKRQMRRDETFISSPLLVQ